MKREIVLALALLLFPSFSVAEEREPPPALVKAIARHESGLNPLAVNIAGKSYYPATREEAERLIREAQTIVSGAAQRCASGYSVHFLERLFAA